MMSKLHMTKPCVFYFSFMSAEGEENEDGSPLVRDYGFNISEAGVARCIESLDKEDANWEDFIEWMYEEGPFDELEGNYGVHDWGTSRTDEVFGIGFNTYEVELPRILELMGKWRAAFVGVAGEENVSRIIDIGGESNLGASTDYSIYQIIEKEIKNNE